MSEQLKPCPFCGGEGVVSEACHGFYAACNSKDDNCDAALGYSECHDYSYGAFETREEAIRAWNARAAPVVVSIPHDMPMSKVADWLIDQSSRDFSQHEVDAIKMASRILAALE